MKKLEPIIHDKGYEIIYHGTCTHLDIQDIRSGRCLKHYWEVYNIQQRSGCLIASCDDFIRLQYQHDQINNITNGYWQVCYDSVVWGIINDYLPKFSYRESKYNPLVSYTVCFKPLFRKKITLFDAVKTLIERNGSYCWFETDFEKEVFKAMTQVSVKLLKYGNKGQRQQAEVLLRRIEKQHISFKYQPEIIFELFLLFFELQTQIKN